MFDLGYIDVDVNIDTAVAVYTDIKITNWLSFQIFPKTLAFLNTGEK